MLPALGKPSFLVQGDIPGYTILKYAYRMLMSPVASCFIAAQVLRY